MRREDTEAGDAASRDSAPRDFTPRELRRLDADVSIRVTVIEPWAEVVGALLMDRLGTFAEEREVAGAIGSVRVTLVFYPGEDTPTEAQVLALIPPGVAEKACVDVETQTVSRDWVDGWKAHFHPVVIGRVRVRPPWEKASSAADSLVDAVINPGLGFGTGLHPTTRGTLKLLQEKSIIPGEDGGRGPRDHHGALVDCGTGSGILSVAAAKLGWGPVVAFDNDGVALLSARENIQQNGVEDLVEVHECDLLHAPLAWFEGATVVANMTLKPVLVLIDKLEGSCLSRVIVSGILAGEQESQVVDAAVDRGFAVGRRLYEAEWVSMELLPDVTSGRG